MDLPLISQEKIDSQTYLFRNQEVLLDLEALEMQYDKNFKIVFDALRRLLAEDEKPKPQIGFKAGK